MSDKKNGLIQYVIIAIGFIGTLALILGISYAMVAALTWAIFWCFGWQWSWLTALGIWLLAIFLRWILKPKKSDPK